MNSNEGTNTTVSESNKEKRELVSFKDIVMAYRLEGMDGVKRHHNTGNVSKDTYKKAIKTIKEAKNDCADLEAWFTEQYPATASRGRTPPKAGDKRVYSTQQVAKTGPFLRLPLDSLGVVKQQKVVAFFDNDEIRIRAANDEDLKEFVKENGGSETSSED